MSTPSEHSPDSPPPDRDAPRLEMPEPWKFAYERISEGHTAAVLNEMDHPGDEEARALLHATSAAVRAFREVYQKTRTAGLAAQIIEIGPGPFDE